MQVNNLYSELYPCDASGNTPNFLPDSLKNNLSRFHYKMYAGADFSYKTGKFKVNATLPVNYNHYQLKNKIYTINNESANKLYLEPSIYIQYILNSKIEINANTSFYNGMNGINELYSGFLLENYRYLNQYNSHLADFHGSYHSLDFAYKNIIKQFFTNATVFYSMNKNSIIYSQHFENNLQVSSLVFQPTQSSIGGVVGKAGKGFDWMRLNIDFGASWQVNASQVVRQDNLVNYTTDMLNLSGKLNIVPVHFLTVSLATDWQQRHSRIKKQETFKPVHVFTNTLNIAFKLSEQLWLGARLEQYYSNAFHSNKLVYFSDIHLNYRWKQIHFELDWNNMLNVKNYIRSSHDGMNEYQSVYRIRPASILLKARFKLK
ncbi:MAG: hypothetical protein LBD45_05680 [Bacteroidales bacterium]|jgi:hypothetical protein|nr:hypothetical protein [Bacteroidales bacterium]